MCRLYENLVFNELKRRNPNQTIYYWMSQQKEAVDFVIKQNLKVKQLIQVCYDIEDYDTKKRELRALLKASKELKCRNLLVITEDKKGEEKILTHDMYRLRKKIEPDPKKPRYIQTRSGLGYMFVAPNASGPE